MAQAGSVIQEGLDTPTQMNLARGQERRGLRPRRSAGAAEAVPTHFQAVPTHFQMALVARAIWERGDRGD
jgi:hypothetical protein